MKLTLPMQGTREEKMVKRKSNVETRATAKTIEKSKKPNTPCSARKNVLGRIGKPHKKATKAQKKFFKDFLNRLEKRDEELEQSDLAAASEDAIAFVYNDEMEKMELQWEVEEILDAATINREIHYMVLWKGHLIKECTWEAKANLANSSDTIDDFYLAFPKKTGGPEAPRRRGKPAVDKDA